MTPYWITLVIMVSAGVVTLERIQGYGDCQAAGEAFKALRPEVIHYECEQ